MKIRNLVLICSLAILCLTVHGQDNIVEKGSKMITGLGSFSNLHYDNTSGHMNTLAVSASYLSFCKDHVFIGDGLSLAYQGVEGQKTTLLTLGPEIGYAFGNEDSRIYPFIDGVCHLDYSSYSGDYNSNSIGGGYTAGFGLIIPVQRHLGLVIEAQYNRTKYFDYGVRQTTLSLNFGLAGLLF